MLSVASTTSARPMARRQPVTTGEPGSAFGDIDRSHPGILPT